MKMYQLNALCVSMLGVSTKGNNKRDVSYMEMRSVLDEQRKRIWGLSVTIAPTELPGCNLVAFSMDNSNDADETIDRCLSGSVGESFTRSDLSIHHLANEENRQRADSHVIITESKFLYEPERMEDSTHMSDLHVHGLGCWNISSLLKDQLVSEKKLEKNEEKWWNLNGDEFIRLAVKGVYVIDWKRYEYRTWYEVSSRRYIDEVYEDIPESNLVLPTDKYGGSSFNQKMEFRFGDEMIKLPDEAYPKFTKKLHKKGYAFSEDHKYVRVKDNGKCPRVSMGDIVFQINAGICSQPQVSIDSIVHKNSPVHVVRSDSDAWVVGNRYVRVDKIGIDTSDGTIKYNFFRQDKRRKEKGREEKRNELSQASNEDSRAEASNKRLRLPSDTNAAEASSSKHGAHSGQEEIDEEYD